LEELENRIKLLKDKVSSKQANIHGKFNYSRLLIDLISGLIVGASLGYIADNYFETLPVFLFIFTILGTMGGFYNFYKELRFIEKDLVEEQKE
jgi:ATP synthase protein I